MTNLKYKVVIKQGYSQKTCLEFNDGMIAIAVAGNIMRHAVADKDSDFEIPDVRVVVEKIEEAEEEKADDDKEEE